MAEYSREGIENMVRGFIASVELDAYGETGPSSRRSGERGGDCLDRTREIVRLADEANILAHSQLVAVWSERRGGSSGISHWVAVIGEPGVEYVVDITGLQFDDPEGPLRDAPITTDENSPFKEQLRRDGFFPITEETINAYLDMLQSPTFTPPTRRLDVNEVLLVWR